MLASLHLECLVSHGKQLTAQLLPDHHAVNTHQTSAGGAHRLHGGECRAVLCCGGG